MNRNYFYTAIFTTLLLLLSLPLFSDENSHGKSIEQVFELIRDEQNVASNKDINPEKVSDDLLEEFGEAVMSLMHPDERQHEWMDNMMGGEGSASLRSAHIMMGYNYLTGGNSFTGRGMMGNGWMMPMMGSPYSRDWGMHSFFLNPGNIAMFIGIIIVIGAVIAFLIFLNNKKADSQNPIDILKIRLAKGEITKDVFNELKQNIL